ncbi:isovaleryl-CoA dehydrogenase [Hypericibacter adhaerens]|uniref:Isovaleryl-CoA dehydrogenase n=1 Tax=Hypericibacter adhaerens TaxID=2602016 RepID=A0A5J6N5P8_9PROT|nr:acyl-CoA dehydrogenase family protein [Hypericibacter adhaerens]QEX25238.1 isovaleryl-CoA dehydrogenase [Hypericibacter adhaerens]
MTADPGSIAGFDAAELAVLETVRRFVAKEVRPEVMRLEREGAYPEALLERMRGLGLFGLAIPEEQGGLGLRLPVFAAIMEELAKGWTSLAAYVNSHSTVAYVIGKHGTGAQRARYLPKMATGELRAALCLTEPGAGSDLQAIATTARPAGDGFTLSGSKFFVTNGRRADLLLVLAKTDPAAQPAKRGISLLLVEKEIPGVKVAGTFHKMAYGQVDTVEILFQDALVPSAALVGGEAGRGLQQLFDGLEVGRIAIAASAVGLAADALNEARRYAGERKAFGVTIDQHQAVQLRLAEMATRLVAARLITREAAQAKAEGNRADMISGMAKLFASETCSAIVDDALRIHGGYGYVADYPIERLYREAPLYIVGEGTNDIQKLVIARRILEGQDIDLLGLPQ